jgi:hypothetical protein
MHFGLSVTVAVFAFSIMAYSSTATGTVLDPQHRALVGARVNLSCGGTIENIITDAEGHFELSSQPSFAHCLLRVNHQGFETLEQILEANPRYLTIELQIATDRRVLDVVSKVQDIREIAESSIGSVSVSGAELEQISNNTADLIDYAKALAGVDMPEDSVYIDGLPGAALPPANMIARIDVNADPFSAEYSDSDKTHINITTKNADRHFHFNFGGAGFGVGGNNPLAPALHTVSHTANLGLSSGVPHAPLSFSLHGNLGSVENHEPIVAVTAPNQSSLPSGQSAVVDNHNASGQFNLHYARSETTQVDLSFADSASSGSNIGVGGLTLPQAGSASLFHTHEGRLTFASSGQGYVYRGGFVLDETSSRLQANDSSLGINVVGAFVDGGAAMTSSSSRHTNWTWKNVLQSNTRRHLWSAGLTLIRTGISNGDQPNAFGSLEFSSLQDYVAAQSGSSTGTWFLTQGNGGVHYATFEVAPFLQGDLFHSENLLVTGGIRGDYQTQGGMMFSPRLSLAARMHGFVIRAGGGQFVHDWLAGNFVHVLEDDGLHLQSFIIQSISLAQAAGPSPTGLSLSGNSVIAQLSTDLTRPRDWIVKASVEHSIGPFSPAIEYTWMDGQHLLGSERESDPNGWLDVLESNRERQRQQLHARLRFPWKSQKITAHYEWIFSNDNTGGPFSFPVHQGDLAAEWARSAGISPHNFTLVDNFNLPGKIAINLIATSRSSAPYNITTGLDDGNGLYNDRGGRHRNSGRGPSYSVFDFSGNRRIPVPLPGKPERRLYANLGVRVSNLLGNKNYTGYDSVVDSPLFGKPLGAGPGRALRFWLNLE